ncbi:MAG: NUDIX domain-containing protein [Candidatus Pacebacteria bacterium]|nr:NUDIX domain-containing protein [Candidatus Paceibacterota bacterium]
MEEQIDILDKDGNKTGEVRSKKEVHLRGDWHRTVHVWFLNSKGQLLLQRRSKNKETSPGKWDISAAGHISADQSSIEAAQREVFEEIGVKIDISELIYIDTVISDKTAKQGAHIDREFNDIYLVKRDLILSELKLQESEVDEVKYVDIKDFEQWVQNKRDDLCNHSEEYQKLLSFLKK